MACVLIPLAAGDWEAELCPALGGSITGLRYAGRDIFRPAPPLPSNVLDSSCFPMVPYCNRIAHGKLSFGGRDFQLRLNFGDHPHPLHGVGWQSAWSLKESGVSAAHLAFLHDAHEDWPYEFEAEQHFSLSPEGFQISLQVTNRTDSAMPAGLGFHPYFARHPNTALRFCADRMWLTDETQIPNCPVAADYFGNWSEKARIDGKVDIDNAFDGWTGEAQLYVGDCALHLASSRPGWLHLFAPANADFFCLEPTSHGPDAMGQKWPMDVLAPGASTSLTMTITRCSEGMEGG